jgi:hypothetical protein
MIALDPVVGKYTLLKLCKRDSMSKVGTGLNGSTGNRRLGSDSNTLVQALGCEDWTIRKLAGMGMPADMDG